MIQFPFQIRPVSFHRYNVSSRLLVSIDPFDIDTNAAVNTDDGANAAVTNDDGDNAAVYITDSVFCNDNNPEESFLFYSTWIGEGLIVTSLQSLCCYSYIVKIIILFCFRI